MWVVESTAEKDDDTGEPLYWNNLNGWVDLKSASTYVLRNSSLLPVDSKWVWKDLNEENMSTDDMAMKIAELEKKLEQSEYECQQLRRNVAGAIKDMLEERTGFANQAWIARLNDAKENPQYATMSQDAAVEIASYVMSYLGILTDRLDKLSKTATGKEVVDKEHRVSFCTDIGDKKYSCMGFTIESKLCRNGQSVEYYCDANYLGKTLRAARHNVQIMAWRSQVTTALELSVEQATLLGQMIEARRVARTTEKSSPAAAQDQTDPKLNLDNNAARALHRVVRAMHDGECPNCHKLHDSADVRLHAERAERTGRSFVGWQCPYCSFMIEEREAAAILKTFGNFMEESLMIFKKWRNEQRQVGGVLYEPNSGAKQ